MRKKYASRIEHLLIWPLVAINIFLSAYFFINGSWFFFSLTLLALACVIFLVGSVYYEISSTNKLRVHCGGLFPHEIYINSIRRIRKVNDYSLAPALSHQRLEISYNRYGRILVSPVHSDRFISDLIKANPRIQFEPPHEIHGFKNLNKLTGRISHINN